MDFLWHTVSEHEKEEIKKQAKGIMDSFSKKLEKIDVRKLKEPIVEREKWEREEKSRGCLPFDREIMFENAPRKNDGFIVAEKGEWK